MKFILRTVILLVLFLSVLIMPLNIKADYYEPMAV